MVNYGRKIERGLGVENRQLKMDGRSQRAQVYIIVKGLVYSLQKCQFQCDLLPGMYDLCILNRVLLFGPHLDLYQSFYKLPC